ncbi:MAG: peptidoglycan -binding protein [Kiloniellales bacterium]|nr:peptidoglycan -binding protein [Kiloniellales bacterium]
MYALGRTGGRRAINIWPGFVDGLATLLLVVIFVLMVFMIAQYFLSVALSGRDLALQQLREEVSSLADLLSLERADNAELRLNVAQLSAELQTSIEARDALSSQLATLSDERESLLGQIASLMTERDDLSGRVAELDDERASLAAQLAALSGRAEENEAEAARLEEQLADAYRAIDADKEKIEALVAEIAILQSLRDEVTAQLLAAEQALEEQRELSESQRQELAAVETLAADREAALSQLRLRISKAEESASAAEDRAATQSKLTEEAQRKVDLLNRQIASLREQLGRLNEILDATETQNKEQQVQIADLGRRLNIALASKVQELARYRSEFFGRLRQVLGEHPDIRIVGDRFVFQSEVLFDTGSAELGEEGKQQLARLARTLLGIAHEIPPEIDWVLRVDGHTDNRPIRTSQFPSNWELSTARAISVVKFLISQGLPPNRVAATGFGEYQPIDPDDDEIAYRRNRRIELKLTQR